MRSKELSINYLDITLDRFREARRRISEYLPPSPLVRLDAVKTLKGAPVFVKAESLQPSGSFKIRGALFAISSLTSEQRECGVIAYSAGNHIYAVAMAAARIGIRATVVISLDLSERQVQALRQCGAEIVMAEAHPEARRALAEKLAAEQGAFLVPPYDHPSVIIGQGTIGIELLEQVRPAAVYIPIGGGGLIAGVAAALKQMNPRTRLVGVEPELENDAVQSFKAGMRVVLPESSASIADAIKVEALGNLPFPIIQRYVDDIVTVSEKQIVSALETAFQAGRLVLEPAGAVALAAALASKMDYGSEPVVAIGSGGNIELGRWVKLIGSSQRAMKGAA